MSYTGEQMTNPWWMSAHPSGDKSSQVSPLEEETATALAPSSSFPEYQLSSLLPPGPDSSASLQTKDSIDTASPPSSSDNKGNSKNPGAAGTPDFLLPAAANVPGSYEKDVALGNVIASTDLTDSSLNWQKNKRDSSMAVSQLRRSRGAVLDGGEPVRFRGR